MSSAVSLQDTICAPATAPGGAVTILRLSGPRSLAVARRLWEGERALDAPENARRLLLGRMGDGRTDACLDAACLAVYMPGPRSYTGEDVVEFHLHGGAVAARLACHAILSCGVRAAEPGEFTRRAFLNGKMDLTQAEAVADLVSAESEQALHLANRQLEGDLRRAIQSRHEQLTLLLSEVESRLDFPEEELDWMAPETVAAALEDCRKELQRLAESRREGELLRHGARLVIAGAPNVGKSSLLNRLLGRSRAIVSPIPGTTRDTVEADFVLQGIPVHVVDTAGARQTEDPVEQDGIARAREAAAEADAVLWLVDATRPRETAWPQWPHRGFLLTAANKCDLAEAEPGLLPLSATTGQGLELLREELARRLRDTRGGDAGWAPVAVSARHGRLLDVAIAALEKTRALVESREWALAAIPVRQAIAALGGITGQTVEPDVLDTIFHRFCIGK
ncbi:MAG: tRNA uridine-5-carboxymethylaminomethyl(34) synthesis GTPase MnmE [Oligosphaeraceae bacterium]